MRRRISITSNSNGQRIVLCKAPRFVSLEIYTDMRWISDGDRDCEGQRDEDQHFLSDNAPPPPAHTKATCPWRENTMPLFPPSFPRPLRHRTGEKGPHAPTPETRQADGGTHQPTQLVPQPFPSPSTNRPRWTCPGRRLGREKQRANAPLEVFKGGKPLMKKTKTNAQSCWRDALCL